MTFLLSEKKKHRRLKGFSIGEVLLAAFVLTSGLMATSALMATSLHNSFETRDAIIATQLSQEGVELVRNVRDNDFADGGDGFSAFDNSKEHCRVSYNDTLGAFDCRNNGLGRPSSHGDLYTLSYIINFYKHNDATSEKFSRYIHTEYSGGSSPQATVTSFVYWGGSVAGMFDVSTAESNGDTSDCTVKKKCVYTEVTLTSWK